MKQLIFYIQAVADFENKYKVAIADITEMQNSHIIFGLKLNIAGENRKNSNVEHDFE